jgi:hypothetical protein
MKTDLLAAEADLAIVYLLTVDRKIVEKKIAVKKTCRKQNPDLRVALEPARILPADR